jgi:plastocyanin domain-containing protein
MKLVIALALLLPSMALAQSCCEGKEPAKEKHPPVTAKLEKGVQKATVVIDGSYMPSVVKLAKGKPVEITFKRLDDSGYTETLVVKSLNFRKTLKKGESTVVRFTPKKAGDVEFTCGMSMLKGKIVVK